MSSTTGEPLNAPKRPRLAVLIDELPRRAPASPGLSSSKPDEAGGFGASAGGFSSGAVPTFLIVGQMRAVGRDDERRVDQIAGRERRRAPSRPRTSYGIVIAGMKPLISSCLTVDLLARRIERLHLALQREGPRCRRAWRRRWRARRESDQTARDKTARERAYDLSRTMIWIGTSGYNYPEWKGSFYPADLPRRRCCRTTRRGFPTVEINYTFYRMPNEKLVAGWAAQTPSPYKLTLKAPRRITHDSRLKNVRRSRRRRSARSRRRSATSSARCCSSCRRT